MQKNAITQNQRNKFAYPITAQIATASHSLEEFVDMAGGEVVHEVGRPAVDTRREVEEMMCVFECHPVAMIVCK